MIKALQVEIQIHPPPTTIHLPLPRVLPVHRGVGDLPSLLHIVLQILKKKTPVSAIFSFGTHMSAFVSLLVTRGALWADML